MGYWGCPIPLAIQAEVLIKLEEIRADIRSGGLILKDGEIIINDN